MKNVDRNLIHGSIKRLYQGWSSKVSCSLVGVALIIAPQAARADSAPVTQFQFLQTIVQLSGASSQFNSSSTAADYVHWAQSKGINPAGGWQPDAVLSKAALAQALVPLLNLNPNKFNGDYARILLREGIDLSGVGDQVSKDNLVGVLDQTRGQITPFVSPGKNTPNGPPPTNPGLAHRPPGSFVFVCRNGHTLAVGVGSLDAQLAAGATLGKCVITP
jgi:hypothetical protein